MSFVCTAIGRIWCKSEFFGTINLPLLLYLKAQMNILYRYLYKRVKVMEMNISENKHSEDKQTF